MNIAVSVFTMAVDYSFLMWTQPNLNTPIFQFFFLQTKREKHADRRFRCEISIRVGKTTKNGHRCKPIEIIVKFSNWSTHANFFKPKAIFFPMSFARARFMQTGPATSFRAGWAKLGQWPSRAIGQKALCALAWEKTNRTLGCSSGFETQFVSWISFAPKYSHFSRACTQY